MQYPIHAKPFIGISAAYDADAQRVTLKDVYTRAILQAGGVPFILPYATDEADILQSAAPMDGILFSGGGDIHPMYYGAPVLPSMVYEPERDAFELSLFRHCVATNKPMLGICRGCQLLAVAAGGKIVQDLPGHADGTRHVVRVLEQSPLWQFTQDKPCVVNSFHHQAVSVLPPQATLCAVTEDGITEAFTLPYTMYCLGVQWHPERMRDALSEGIFLSFIEACTKR